MTRGRVARLVAGRGWAIGPTLISIAASGTAAATTLVIAWGIGAGAFGQFTLVLSIALIVNVGMLMSLNYVAVQELPRGEPVDRAALVTTALYSTLMLSAGTVVLGVLAAPVLTAVFGVDAGTLYFALALALALAVNQLTESFLRGLKRFQFVATLKLVIAGVYLAAASYCLLGLHIRVAEVYLIALIVTNIVFAIVAMVGIAAGIAGIGAGRGLEVRPRSWSAALARSLYRHGAYVSAIAALTAIIFGLDVVLLNHLASPADVGVYSVYNGFPKRLLGVVFTEGIGLVLLPLLATMEKPALLRQIGRHALAIGPAAAVLSFAASAVFFLLLRAEYPYSLGLMALSAVGIGAHTVFNLYFFALSMDGMRGAKVFIGCLAGGLPVVLIGQATFTAWWGLVGALVAFPLTNLLLVAVVVAMIGRVYADAPRSEVGR